MPSSILLEPQMENLSAAVHLGIRTVSFTRSLITKTLATLKPHMFQLQKHLQPNGPLQPSIIEKIKTQMGEDPSRWRREMEAEWAEDDDVWLTQSLIAQCIGTAKECGEDLQNLKPDACLSGDLFAGLDLAQTRDYTVLAVIERQNDKLLLRHLKIFQQPTLYATVIGYIKELQDRWGGFQKIRVDFTREGPSIIADMTSAGIDNAEGVNFSVPARVRWQACLSNVWQTTNSLSAAELGATLPRGNMQ